MQTAHTMIRIEDVDWKGVESTLLNERVNARMLRERFASSIAAPTFKKWMATMIGERYTVDWGRQGKNNYIRLLPKDGGDQLTATMRNILRNHSLDQVVRALAKATDK